MRNVASGLPLAVGLAVGAWFLVRAGISRLNGTPFWDGHLIVAASWAGLGALAALVVRLLFATIAPERFLPRRLAIPGLLLLAAAGLAIWLVFLWGAAWGP